jgi:hypothetical protein
VVETQVALMSCSRQDTTRDQTAGHMLRLSPVGAGLTARQTAWILPHLHHCRDRGADAREPPSLRSGQRQAMGGHVCGAVSDDQHLEAPRQPTSLRPGGLAPRRSQDLVMKPPVLLQATHNVPAIVMHALQQGVGGLPGIKAPRRGAPAQTLARRAEERSGPRVRRRSPLTPQADPRRDAERAMGPDHPHERDAIDRLTWRAGEALGQALPGGRKGLRHDRIVVDPIAPRPDAPRATGACEACVPRPVALQPSRQAVMGHGFSRLRSRDTAAGGAILESRGAIVPQEHWPGVPSCVIVGPERYAISPLPRNL